MAGGGARARNGALCGAAARRLGAFWKCVRGKIGDFGKVSGTLPRPPAGSTSEKRKRSRSVSFSPKRGVSDSAYRCLYRQSPLKEAGLFNDFRIGKTDANHPFTDSRVYGGCQCPVFTWDRGATGHQSYIRASGRHQADHR